MGNGHQCLWYLQSYFEVFTYVLSLSVFLFSFSRDCSNPRSNIRSRVGLSFNNHTYSHSPTGHKVLSNALSFIEGRERVLLNSYVDVVVLCFRCTVVH